MNNHNFELKTQLERYFQGTLSKETLGLWAGKEYYQVLKGELVMIDRLVGYRFLSAISTINTKVDDAKGEFPCSEEEVKEIHRILNGEKNAVVSGYLQISPVFYNFLNIEEKLKIYIEIRNLILELQKNGSLSDEKMDQVRSYSKKKVTEIYTVIDLLEAHITDLVSMYLSYEDEEGDEEDIYFFKHKFSLYSKAGTEEDKDIIKDLIKLLDCMTGLKPFRICISYVEGIPSLSLLL